MIYLDRAKVGQAAEALMLAAIEARDARSLRICTDLPLRQPSAPATEEEEAAALILPAVDLKRVESIVLGALVALCNGPVCFSDEVQVGFGNPVPAS